MKTQDPKTGALSEHDVDFFKAFGFIVLKNVFAPAELKTIDQEFERTMADQYAHKPFDGSQRHWTMMLDEETPFFASLMEDPRFLTPARQFYGPDVLGVAADANRYVGDSGWHRDIATVDQYGIKYAFYLQPVKAETGALRVVPGSHAFPDNAEFNKLMHNFSIGEVPAQVLESEPGDVVAFDVRCWHGSLGGSADRRMCTVVYYTNPTTEQEEKAVREIAALSTKVSFKTFGCRREYLYSKKWVSNPNRSPARQQWIDRLRSIGYFDVPGVVEPSES